MTPSAQVENVMSQIQKLCEGLTEAQMNWRPSPGAWSISECLDHLTVTATTFSKAIEAGVAKAPKAAKREADAALRPPWWGRMFLQILEPPVARFKVKAPPHFQPRAARDSMLVLAEFSKAHTELLQKWPKWAQIDMRRTKVRGVFPVPFPLILVMHVIPTHMRRHLWQARQVTSARGFPQSEAQALTRSKRLAVRSE
jgi:hypothetical protein